MKALIVLMMAVLVFAQDTPVVEPGILPDNPLWYGDIIIDSVMERVQGQERIERNLVERSEEILQIAYRQNVTEKDVRAIVRAQQRIQTRLEGANISASVNQYATRAMNLGLYVSAAANDKSTSGQEKVQAIAQAKIDYEADIEAIRERLQERIMNMTKAG